MQCSSVTMLARLLPAAGIAATTALAAASPALATPTLNVPIKPCYVAATPDQREPVAIDAAGFTPNAYVDPFVDGVQQAVSGQADAVGHLKGQVQAPWVAEGEQPFTLALVERGNPANTLTLTSKVTALSVSTTPDRARPWRRVRYHARGFTEARPVYAHYVYKGKLRRTVRLGVPHDDCGVVSVRRRLIPVHHPGTGEWTVLVDQRRHYPTTVPPPVQARMIVTVRQVPRS